MGKTCFNYSKTQINLKEESRSFVFTINNHTFGDLLYCIRMMESQPTLRYQCFGFEHEDEGTPHIQGYLYFSSVTTVDRIRADMPRARFEPARGTCTQNQVYTSKEGDWYEFGDPPAQGRASFDKIEAVMKNPESNFQLFTQYRKSFNEYKSSIAPADRERKIKIIHEHLRFQVARHYKDLYKTVCIYPAAYLDGETDVLIVPAYYQEHCILNWQMGFPPTYRNGYEMKWFDPGLIIFYVSTPKEYNYLVERYNTKNKISFETIEHGFETQLPKKGDKTTKATIDEAFRQKKLANKSK